VWDRHTAEYDLAVINERAEWEAEHAGDVDDSDLTAPLVAPSLRAMSVAERSQQRDADAIDLDVRSAEVDRVLALNPSVVTLPECTPMIAKTTELFVELLARRAFDVTCERGATNDGTPMKIQRMFVMRALRTGENLRFLRDVMEAGYVSTRSQSSKRKKK
jgi:hypothetical protein